MHIQPALPKDTETLTVIALAAKRHWGYPEAWIQRWADELTFTAESLSIADTFKAVIGNQIVGVCTLKLGEADAEITALWILPEFIGNGIGRALFEHAESLARSHGAPRLIMMSDPHAEGFYQRMGAAVYGQHPAPMDDTPRFLPLMGKAL